MVRMAIFGLNRLTQDMGKIVSEHGVHSRMPQLKCVFNIAIETCSQWGGVMKVIACIEDPAVIEKIRTRLKETASAKLSPLHESWAPPQAVLFDSP